MITDDIIDRLANDSTSFAACRSYDILSPTILLYITNYSVIKVNVTVSMTMEISNTSVFTQSFQMS